MGSTVLSCIGLADDSALLSGSLSKLAGLLHLTVQYCQQYHVELVPDKNIFLSFTPANQQMEVYLQKLVNPLTLNGHNIDVSSSADHVGILRSIEGNMPNI